MSKFNLAIVATTLSLIAACGGEADVVTQCADGSARLADGNCVNIDCGRGFGLDSQRRCVKLATEPAPYPCTVDEALTVTGKCIKVTDDTLICDQGYLLDERQNACVKPATQCALYQYRDADGVCQELPEDFVFPCNAEAGEAMLDNGQCVNPEQSWVAVGEHEWFTPRESEVLEGGFAYLFPLRIESNAFPLRINLSFILYASNSGISSTWESSHVANLLESCYMEDGEAGSLYSGQIISDTTTIAAFHSIIVESQRTIWLVCNTRQLAANEDYLLAAEFTGIGAFQASEPLDTAQQVEQTFFWGTNNSFRRNIKVGVLSTQPEVAPTVSLAANSPSGAAVPTFGAEVIRFNVSTTEDIEVLSFDYNIISTDNTGSNWSSCAYIDAEIVLVEENRPRVSNSYSCNGQLGNSYTINQDIQTGTVVIIGGQSKTLAIHVDTTGANASRDDILQIEIAAVCWRNLQTSQVICQGLNPRVRGGTLVF